MTWTLIFWIVHTTAMGSVSEGRPQQLEFANGELCEKAREAFLKASRLFDSGAVCVKTRVL